MIIKLLNRFIGDDDTKYQHEVFIYLKSLELKANEDGDEHIAEWIQKLYDLESKYDKLKIMRLSEEKQELKE